MAGPAVVKIGDQVVPHSDWLSKVRKNKSHTHIVFYIVVPFYYEVMANSDRLSKVKEMFFFTFFCLFTFITSLFQLSDWLSKSSKVFLCAIFLIHFYYEFISAQRLICHVGQGSCGDGTDMSCRSRQLIW